MESDLSMSSPTSRATVDLEEERTTTLGENYDELPEGYHECFALDNENESDRITHSQEGEIRGNK